MYVCMYVSMYVCIYVCMHVCICVCIYMYIKVNEGSRYFMGTKGWGGFFMGWGWKGGGVVCGIIFILYFWLVLI